MIEKKSLQEHEFFMKRCLELASAGLGYVAPNPLVGAVVVCDNKIIGEGFHRKYGGDHAEVNAVRAVKKQVLLAKSTLYVNLEPCAHMGKTPPCTDLILEKGIPRVVIGTTDPNALVSGRGIEKLKRAGVDVIQNVLPGECRELNKRFFTFHEKKRPFIILKWAQTSDGFMDLARKPGEPVGVNWISNPLSRKLVHKWRAEEQAIMAGTDTILFDDPELTLRLWRGNPPLRIVIDRKLRIPKSAKVLNGSVRTLLYNEKQSKTAGNTEFVKVETNGNIFGMIFRDLYDREILSVIVEGGKKVLEYLIENELWDEARVFVGEKTFENGLKAPAMVIKPANSVEILTDKLLFYRKT
ncbi:MAG: bifunctional diaminohydroxyphosphoribosylaminopyrimidine deaminase/5-amino-6-(5-phosphoribosylamino)uracil reductase RibD [Bacteroidales bacterium]|jgi:diaminohydroxyphosphoribosylaminopyrimidine deaminase/5-amino-6-(5-phosphoribosylamino)uracil reductase